MELDFKGAYLIQCKIFKLFKLFEEIVWNRVHSFAAFSNGRRGDGEYYSFYLQHESLPCELVIDYYSDNTNRIKHEKLKFYDHVIERQDSEKFKNLFLKQLFEKYAVCNIDDDEFKKNYEAYIVLLQVPVMQDLKDKENKPSDLEYFIANRNEIVIPHYTSIANNNKVAALTTRASELYRNPSDLILRPKFFDISEGSKFAEAYSQYKVFNKYRGCYDVLAVAIDCIIEIMSSRNWNIIYRPLGQ